MERTFNSWIQEDEYASNYIDGPDYLKMFQEAGIKVTNLTPKKLKKCLKKLPLEINFRDVWYSVKLKPGFLIVKDDLRNHRIEKSEHEKIYEAIYQGYEILEESINDSFKTNHFLLSLEEKDENVKIEMIKKERERNYDQMMAFKVDSAMFLSADRVENEKIIRLIEMRSFEIIQYIDGDCYSAIMHNLVKNKNKVNVMDDINMYHPYAELIYGVLYDQFLLQILNMENNRNQTNISTMLKLSEKRGSKIKLIKILKALHSLNLLEKSDGSGFPKIEEFMTIFGEFIGREDFDEYANDIKGSKKNSVKLESYLEVFESLKQDAKNDYEDYYK